MTDMIDKDHCFIKESVVITNERISFQLNFVDLSSLERVLKICDVNKVLVFHVDRGKLIIKIGFYPTIYFLMLLIEDLLPPVYGYERIHLTNDL